MNPAVTALCKQNDVPRAQYTDPIRDCNTPGIIWGKGNNAQGTKEEKRTSFCLFVPALPGCLL